jgi:hypothetical protein
VQTAVSLNVSPEPPDLHTILANHRFVCPDPPARSMGSAVKCQAFAITIKLLLMPFQALLIGAKVGQ